MKKLSLPIYLLLTSGTSALPKKRINKGGNWYYGNKAQLNGMASLLQKRGMGHDTNENGHYPTLENLQNEADKRGFDNYDYGVLMPNYFIPKNRKRPFVKRNNWYTGNLAYENGLSGLLTKRDADNWYTGNLAYQNGLGSLLSKRSHKIGYTKNHMNDPNFEWFDVYNNLGNKRNAKRSTTGSWWGHDWDASNSKIDHSAYDNENKEDNFDMFSPDDTDANLRWSYENRNENNGDEPDILGYNYRNSWDPEMADADWLKKRSGHSGKGFNFKGFHSRMRRSDKGLQSKDKVETSKSEVDSKKKSEQKEDKRNVPDLHSIINNDDMLPW